MFCTQPIRELDAASCRRELGAGSACCGIMPPGKALRCSLWGQERRFTVSCRGPPEKALRCFPLTGLYGSTAEKPPTGRFFWIVRIGSLLGGFSLTKAPSFAIRNLDCKIHPQRCLNDKGVSSSAELDQRRRLWKLPPFEKGGRKLYFIETRSREVKSLATHSTDT